jgi:hypothetical protein
MSTCNLLTLGDLNTGYYSLFSPPRTLETAEAMIVKNKQDEMVQLIHGYVLNVTYARASIAEDGVVRPLCINTAVASPTTCTN